MQGDKKEISFLISFWLIILFVKLFCLKLYPYYFYLTVVALAKYDLRKKSQDSLFFPIGSLPASIGITSVLNSIMQVFLPNIFLTFRLTSLQC